MKKFKIVQSSTANCLAVYSSNFSASYWQNSSKPMFLLQNDNIVEEFNLKTMLLSYKHSLANAKLMLLQNILANKIARRMKHESD